VQDAYRVIRFVHEATDRENLIRFGRFSGGFMESSNPTTGQFEQNPPVPQECEAQYLAEPIHTVSVVIPIYQGAHTLEPLVAEIEPLVHVQYTAGGRQFRIAEVILVHDGAIDNSDAVMEKLAARWGFVKLVWLSRNFGQHPATLAGASSTNSEWVVTIDEDGDHNPADIGRFLDVALDSDSQLVYGLPTNAPSHGMVRNLLSAITKRCLIYLLADATAGHFHSFRLIHGEIARSLAAYCGYNVYLDVALSWVVARRSHCPIVLRGSGRRPSSYNYRALAGHFWRLVLTSGTKPLRFVSLLGVGSIGFGGVFASYAVWVRLTGRVPVQGWTSLAILFCFFSGGILLSLGIIAEYVGVAVNTAMGRPLYLMVSNPSCKKNTKPCDRR
jgi:polyisoprenyl-phosphate glycosyltransferase